MGRTKDLLGKFAAKFLRVALSMAAVILMAGIFIMQAEAATAKVTKSSVKIRQKASTSSEVIGSAANGDTFEIKGEETASDGYVWYKVQVNADTVGYIRSDLVQKSDGGSTGTTTTTISKDGVTAIQPISAKVTGNQVRVRPDASTNGSVVTIVTKDTTVAVNGVADGADNKTWYLVSFQTTGGEVEGFIREDFLALGGEVVPVIEPEEPGDAEVPAEPDTPVEPEEPADYETYEQDGIWYLINNTTDPAYQYKIDDIFKAAETNAELYNGSLKTIKTQKIFIVILVLLLIGGGIAATLLIFKMKDMLDESYFAEIEKDTLNKRQNKSQNVMHTVGKDSVQKKPTVNGQQPKSTVKPQQPGSQLKQMPKQQPAGQPKPNMTATQGQLKPQGQTPQAKPQQAPQGQASQAKPQQAPQGQAPQVKPQQPAQTEKPANTKPNQQFKSKNFMTEDDDFEFEFLNWDGEDDL